MAASCVRRTCSTANRIWCQLWSNTGKSRRLQVFHLLKTPVKRLQLKTLGITVGVSYGLFGFNFGKKTDEESDPLTETYRAARLAHMRNDLVKADELYHECLKLADDSLKAKTITPEKHLTSRTLMYDGLANIALRTGRMEDAEKLFVETMKGCFQEGMAQDHNAIVDISLKLASLYAMQGKKLEAEEGFKFCLHAQNPKTEELEKKWKELTNKKSRKSANPEELEEIERDNAALLGMALSSYGRFLMYEKRHEDALPHFQRAELIARNTLGENCDQYIVVLNDLATLYIMTKNLDQAEQVLKDGIKITDKEKLHEGAMLYCNLGAVHLRRGETIEAMRICQRGLDCATEVDHKLAYKMADSCLKKAQSVLKSKKADETSK